MCKKGINDSDLRNYAGRRIDETNGTSLSSRSIAVLDERSITDSTVVFHQFHFKDLWEDADEPVVGPVEATDNGDLWWKWRVRFNKSWAFWTAVSNMSIAVDTIAMFSEPQYQSPDGVVDVETAMEDHGY